MRDKSDMEFCIHAAERAADGAGEEREPANVVGAAVAPIGKEPKKEINIFLQKY